MLAYQLTEDRDWMFMNPWNAAGALIIGLVGELSSPGLAELVECSDANHALHFFGL